MYQGHKNWNHWNVALWLFNDEKLYGVTQWAVKEYPTLDLAARALVQALPEKTPDGAPYTYSSVRAAIVGM